MIYASITCELDYFCKSNIITTKRLVSNFGTRMEVVNMITTSKKRLSIRRIAIIGMLGSISIVLGLTPLGFIPIGPTRATIMHIPVIIGAIIEGPFVGAMVGLIFGFFSMLNAVLNPTPVSFVFLNPLVAVLPRILIGITSYYSYSIFKKLGKRASIIGIFISCGLILYYLTTTLFHQINQIITKDIDTWEIIIDQIIAGTINIWAILFTFVLIIITILLGCFSYKKLKDKSIEVIISAVIGTLTNTVLVLFMIYILYAQQFVEKLGMDTNTAGKVILGIGIANGIPETIIAILIVTGVIISINKKN